MALPEYETSLLTMMNKFGAAISSATVEKREEALQALVVEGYATMIRNEAGHIKYAITAEGIVYLDEIGSNDKK